ncbi:bZIP transcription factor [Apiospora marii]|uniref:BZIP transcription factor n=1 Tax=Apiospora marii TaxID=335849 RepID=A0ABR1R807_9PEZI
MEDSSHLFSYNINDDSDGEYLILDGSGAAADADEYNQYLPSPGFPPSEDFTVPVRPHLSSGQPSTDSLSSAPTDAPMQSEVNFPTWTPANQGHTRQLQVPSAYGSSFEPPGLSSGSSTTPDTKNSQAVTPENRRGSRNVSIQPKTDAVFPPPLPSGPILPPRRRRPRQPKPKPQLSMEEEEAKKNKTLERNRVAASKCREKKKDWTKDLEETKIGLESQNSHLQMEYSALVKEVGEIRAQLMTHASCHNANIDKWIENEAKKFVLGAGERYDTMLGATPGPSSSNLDAAQGGMPVSAYGASSSDIHFDPSEYRTSLSQRESAAMPNSPAFFQDSMSSAGFQNPNDDFASHMMQRTSASIPHIAVNQGSPDFLGSIANDPGGEYMADADFSYGAFQAAQEEGPDDENGLGFPHDAI